MTEVMAATAQWRVAGEYGWQEFDADASRAVAVFTAEQATGRDVRLLCRVGDTEDWYVVALQPACEECGGTRRTVQGWTDKNGYSEDQYGPCAACSPRGTADTPPASPEPVTARTQALAEVAALLESEIMKRPEPGKHSVADHGAVRALADMKKLVTAPGFSFPVPA